MYKTPRVFASEMTCIVSGGALNSTHSLRNPQPVKLAEKRSDALRTPDGEYKSNSGVENGLQPVQQLVGDAGQQ